MPENLGRAVQLALGGLQNGVLQGSFFERQHHFSAIWAVLGALGAFGHFLGPKLAISFMYNRRYICCDCDLTDLALLLVNNDLEVYTFLDLISYISR